MSGMKKVFTTFANWCLMAMFGYEVANNLERQEIVVKVDNDKVQFKPAEDKNDLVVIVTLLLFFVALVIICTLFALLCRRGRKPRATVNL